MSPSNRPIGLDAVGFCSIAERTGTRLIQGGQPKKVNVWITL